MQRKSIIEINLHIGKRLKLRRSLLGLSKKALGKKIGLSAAQIRRCETSVHGINGGQLFELGVALEIPVSYFYEGLYANDPLETALQQMSELPAAFFEDNFFIRPENFEILGHYHRIEDDRLKSDIRQLLSSMGRVCVS